MKIVGYTTAKFREKIIKTRFLHFFITGASGVALNLLTTFFLTKYVFGQDRFFAAYLIGSGVNLTYNFSLHTVITFKTKKRHLRRFGFFIIFSAVSAYVQILTVKVVTDLVGKQWYLLVIAGTILILSIISFIFFKWHLFDEKLLDEDI